ncbi:acetaldehyde dehydrogenase (acetylating) [Clostridium formicaceticum]|uniref:Acetaldehyde dehydrogenase n=1 Tax=Clostridium formicaceticum TaxID=1497 RepID=A0ABN4T9Z6_9CLOT|nr:acetaldehyde dehydrogenase (acetylating) [Clostridium formicaceticum]AOY77942.1 acetaldehyde dehydrogenase (acetylating) [Clostridium formicaceticum]
MLKTKVAIIGPGNIGTDLIHKILRKENLELVLVVGIDPQSKGLQIARKNGIETSYKGIEAVLERDDIKIVFDCTGAKYHLQHAPLLKEAGKIAIDLTPAAVGPYVVPSVNLEEHLASPNINLITCGGQATIPMINAISNVTSIAYAEIVATIASKSAGSGTRQNIDEFTKTTTKGIEIVGKAKKGKAIILLNPAEPPIMMKNTIYVLTEEENPNKEAIVQAIKDREKEIQAYIPGYRVKVGPIVEGNKITTGIEVEGSGDFLPKYSGNLDIINAAAAAIADKLAEKGVAK